MKKYLLYLFVFCITAIFIVPDYCPAQMQKMPIDTLPPHPKWWHYCSSDPGDLYYDSTKTRDPFVEDWPQDNTRSNLSMINMNPDSGYNYRFYYKDFVPGQDASTTWNANVVDPMQDARLVLTFTDRRGNDTTIDVRYYTFKVTVRPDLDFGTMAKGDTAEKDVWLVNESTTSGSYIENFTLKYRDKGFEILNLLPNQFIAPLDSVKIKVRFIATQDGDFIDSIGAGDSCWFYYRVQLKVKVGNPIISVSDWDFGDVPANTNAPAGQISITNKGTIALIITGYSLPTLPVFTTDLRDMTPASPLTLSPGQKYNFNVYFTPTMPISYLDSMVFTSNTAKVPSADSVAILKGRGIQANLIANSYDWGERLIDLTDFPAGPYDANPGDSIIVLKNFGSQYVIIGGIQILSDTNGTAFEFNKDALTNIVIPDSSLLYVPVRFHPKVAGVNKLVFTYDNTANSDTKTTLQGMGIVPNGVNDNNNSSDYFELYPNPVEENLTIQLNNAENCTFRIIDVYGNLVDEISNNAGSQRLNYNTTKLANGLYIVQLNTGKILITKTFIIMR